MKNEGPHGSDAFATPDQLELHVSESEARAQRENLRSREQQGRAQLQELYRHLDHATNGNVYLAWYAQCRAQEMSHRDAIEDTVRHFGLEHTEWYAARGLVGPAVGNGRHPANADPKYSARHTAPAAG